MSSTTIIRNVSDPTQVKTVDNLELNNHLNTGEWKVDPNQNIPISVDGTVKSLPFEDAKNVLATGNASIANQDDIKRYRHDVDVQREVQASPISQGLKALGESSLRAASFGLSDVALKAAGVDPAYMKAREVEHPIIENVVGPALGIGASLLIPGLGEANLSKTALLEGIDSANTVKAAAAALARISGKEAAQTALETEMGIDTIKQLARTALEAKTGTTASQIGTAASYNPVYQLSNLMRGLEQKPGGGALAKIIGTAAETGVYGGTSSITEAALGDPDKAVEHILPNVGMGLLLGGGLE